jgi:FLVCR family MFS transporter 7
VLKPLNYTEEQAGYVGTGFIVTGVIGAVVIGAVTDYTKRYKLTLNISSFCGFLAYLGFLVNSFFEKQLINVVIAVGTMSIVGFFFLPIVPVVLEVGVECTYPVSEGVSTSMLLGFGNVMTAVLISTVTYLFPHVGITLYNVLWLCLAGIIITVVSTLFFFGEYRRYNYEQKTQELSSSTSKTITTTASFSGAILPSLTTEQSINIEQKDY